MKYRVITIDPDCPEANYLIEVDREDGSVVTKYWVHCDNTLPFGCWFRGVFTDRGEGQFPLFKMINTIV